jgi:predicted dinucleotide-binding enzyme
MAGEKKFGGKIIIDVTNPLDFSKTISTRASELVSWITQQIFPNF